MRTPSVMTSVGRAQLRLVLFTHFPSADHASGIQTVASPSGFTRQFPARLVTPLYNWRDMKELASFNRMVRKWADQQPKMYRKTALAFGYRCDMNSHTFDGTLAWISKKSRERKGEGVSRATLVRHLTVFTEHGVIRVETRRDGDRNTSSVYHVDFGKVIAEDADHDAWLSSLGDLPKHVGWDINACAACQALPDGATLETHIANGGDDPWAQPF